VEASAINRPPLPIFIADWREAVEDLPKTLIRASESAAKLLDSE